MIKKQPVLSGKSIHLGCICDADKRRMLVLLTNEEISKTYLLPKFLHPDEAVPLYERLKQLSEDPGRFVYGIYLRDKLIGFLNEVDVEKQEIEVGYVIDPAHKNHGYATEALDAAIHELFRIGFSLVRAGAFEENAASLRVMEKCGMRKTGQTEFLEYRGIVHKCIYCEIGKSTQG